MSRIPDDQSFSSRFSVRPPAPTPTIRTEAPPGLRTAIVSITTRQCGMTLEALRSLICDFTFREPEEQLNWSAGPVRTEIRDILDELDWWAVYDFIEVVYHHLSDAAVQRSNPVPDAAQVFESLMNEAMSRFGIAWQIVNGDIQVRGDEPFETSVAQSGDLLATAGLPVASNELHEALRDLSRMPDPDLSGAIHHAFASLESVARHISNENGTLGEIISRRRDLFSPPMDQAFERMWGFASNMARHASEGRVITFEDAELCVHVCASMCRYLLARNAPTR